MDKRPFASHSQLQADSKGFRRLRETHSSDDRPGKWSILAGRKVELPAVTSGSTSLNRLIHEVAVLREHCAAQECQLEEFAADLEEKEAENESLRKELNLERFKYELAVDLVSRQEMLMDTMLMIAQAWP